MPFDAPTTNFHPTRPGCRTDPRARVARRLALVLLVIAAAQPIGAWAAEPAAPSETPPDAETFASETRRPAEEMVVYGRDIRRTVEVDRSDAAVVVTRDQIEATQEPLLVDVLRGQAGVTVQASGGPGTQTDLRLRGSSADQVQVIIDGVRVGSATTGSFNWANLPAEAIERVEILRGPQSTIFGASAVGGVVLIETRSGAGPLSAELEGGYGSHEQTLLSTRVSGGSERWGSYSLSAVRTTIDAVSATTVPQPGETELEDDSFRNLYVAGRGSVPVGEGSLRFGGRFIDSDVDLDESSVDNPFFQQDTREVQLVASLVYPVLERWSTRLTAARYTLDREGEDLPGSTNNYDISTTSWQASWLNDVDLFGTQILAGIDFESERGENPDAGFDRTVEQTGIFAKAESPERWGASLNGGFRFESNSISRDQVTWQVGATWRPADLLRERGPYAKALDGLVLRANYGTAFRPPTLNDLFFETPGFAIPNPDLRPEESEGFDAGLSYERVVLSDVDLSFDFWGFYQDYEDLIEFRGFPLQPVNVSEAELWGLEANAEVRWRWLSLGASWTYLQSEDGDGFELQRRPEHAGEVRVGVDFERAGGNLTVRAVDSSFSRSRERDEVDAYAVVDLNARLDVTERISVRGRIQNLFDEDYEEIKDRGVLERTLFLSVRVAL
ncbi:MAG: TonB-dependent receptor plug domain-containing protein [bacterium]